MITSEGSSLPIVHIRVVYEQSCKVYPCDYCFKTFTSEKSLSSHICAHHKSVDVQDVFVCSICNCCLLSQSDLLEHAALRHQLQLLGSDASFQLCQYCGAQLPNHETLGKHIEKDHAGAFLKKGCSSSDIIELTLSEISNIGMGDKNCRTLFKVIEIPLEEKENSYCEDPKSLVKGTDDREAYKVKSSGETEVSRVRQDIVVDQKCSKIEGPLNKDFRTKVNMKKDAVLQFDCSKQELWNEASVRSEGEEHENSKLAITVLCEPDESAFPSAKGELVLTVESEEKLVWSKDVVSKVISSSGILRKSSLNDKMLDLLPVSVSREEAEVVTQLYSGTDQIDGNKRLSPANSNVETHIVVGCVDGMENCIAEDKGTDCQKVIKTRDCCICGKRFTNMGELERHEGSVHGVRIKCDLCNDTFAFSKSLKTHYLRKHSNSKSFPCEGKRNTSVESAIRDLYILVYLCITWANIFLKKDGMMLLRTRHSTWLRSRLRMLMLQVHQTTNCSD
ncbi:uncharacterized protein LOC135207002 isoform X2 [Macrobrachium nipponense]|uniref:uncharacterized protein LOC135207002 isoform X2 n=1 Tax=Macrobrachium nipponense TaxID=159736 RepID=UPI0030C8BE1D